MSNVSDFIIDQLKIQEVKKICHDIFKKTAIVRLILRTLNPSPKNIYERASIHPVNISKTEVESVEKLQVQISGGTPFCSLTKQSIIRQQRSLPNTSIIYRFAYAVGLKISYMAKLLVRK